jgi:alkylation response protein AidB-like acyl-CoA dehydrogenase
MEDIHLAQEGPWLGNQFTEDEALVGMLKTFAATHLDFEEDLNVFGQSVVGETLQQHFLCEKFKPTLVQFDAFGKRIDKVVTHPAWDFMHCQAAREGLVAIGYTGLPLCRVHQIVKLLLFAPSSGLYSCPLAMTDGATHLTKKLLEEGPNPQLEEALSHLLTRDPKHFWTSGQWMTEKAGGSDVSRATHTTARHLQGNTYVLSGYKWFTSAVTADVAYTLARVDGKVTLFFVKLRRSDASLNGIQVVRLKDKLGTRQLPTAELVLENCEALRVSPVGGGVKYIAELMNLTRIHNSIAAVGYMRRIIALARDYTFRRQAFGTFLAENPVHQRTLASVEVVYRGCLALLLYVAKLLDETDKGSKTSKTRLRVLTPVIKLYTAKKAMEVVSEGLELIGGVAYMEDSNIPGYLRDAQVLPIWEGTTNVLSLDLIRALTEVNSPKLEVLQAIVDECADPTVHGLLSTRLSSLVPMVTDKYFCRDLAFGVAEVVVAALLSRHATNSANPIDKETSKRWLSYSRIQMTEENKVLTKGLALSGGASLLRVRF